MALFFEEREWDIFFEEDFQSLLPESAGILEFSEVSDSTVPTAPIEDGSFSAYNKIAVPRRLSVKIGCEGSADERGLFEGSLRIAQDSVDTFWICSATNSWHNMTIESISKSTSTTDGYFITIFDVEFVEILFKRQEEKMTQKKQVKDSTLTRIKNAGKQQAKTVTDAASGISDKAKSLLSNISIEGA